MASQGTSVCVLTSRGMAAISSIALAGAGAREILAAVFRSSNPLTPSPLRGTPPWQGESFTILHGVIVEGERVVDEVVVGCESEETFVIHCHGNPLLVERIAKLLQSHGAKLMDTENFAFQKHTEKSNSTIEAEAKLAMHKSATLLGVKILQAQINGGLSTWAQQFADNFDTMTPQDIKDQCQEILERSEVARRIIEGVRIVIAGPPNSGKSTLLNCLAGQQEVIVSEIAGTTRDWVSVTCQLGPLRAEFIDTAGLDDALAGNDTIEQTAQGVTRGLLKWSDLVLHVQDVTEAGGRESKDKMNLACPVIYIDNKCDLFTSRGSGLAAVRISAKENQGIDRLAEEIMYVLGITDLDAAGPVAFTQRQRQLLSAAATEPGRAKETLNGLLYSGNAS